MNPSSNLLIGDLTDLKSHPLWRLDPIEPVDDVQPIAVCIGSDDPLTFATSLLQEHQLLVDALVQAGKSEKEAFTWLNKARENGLRSRFTLPIAAPIPIREYPGPPEVEPTPVP